MKILAAFVLFALSTSFVHAGGISGSGGTNIYYVDTNMVQTISYFTPIVQTAATNAVNAQTNALVVLMRAINAAGTNGVLATLRDEVTGNLSFLAGAMSTADQGILATLRGEQSAGTNAVLATLRAEAGVTTDQILQGLRGEAVTQSNNLVGVISTRVAIALTNRATAGAFGLAKAGLGLSSLAGTLSTAPKAGTAAYNANLTWDGAVYDMLDVTNSLTGALTLVISNMVAGTQYSFTCKSGSSPRSFSVTFPAGTVWPIGGAVQNTTIPANGILILNAQSTAAGDILYAITGAP